MMRIIISIIFLFLGILCHIKAMKAKPSACTKPTSKQIAILKKFTKSKTGTGQRSYQGFLTVFQAVDAGGILSDQIVHVVKREANSVDTRCIHTVRVIRKPQ